MRRGGGGDTGWKPVPREGRGRHGLGARATGAGEGGGGFADGFEAGGGGVGGGGGGGDLGEGLEGQGACRGGEGGGAAGVEAVQAGEGALGVGVVEEGDELVEGQAVLAGQVEGGLGAAGVGELLDEQGGVGDVGSGRGRCVVVVVVRVVAVEAGQGCGHVWAPPWAAAAVGGGDCARGVGRGKRDWGDRDEIAHGERRCTRDSGGAGTGGGGGIRSEIGDLRFEMCDVRCVM